MAPGSESAITGCIRWQGSRARAACHVSNGEHIVEAAPGGRYALPFTKGRHRFIFVIPPDGYRSVTPLWSCCRGDGSPPASTDFQLKKLPERPAGRFSVLHLTDLHIDGPRTDPRILQGFASKLKPGKRATEEPTAARVGRAVRELVARAPDAAFVVVTGDITNWGEPAKLKAAARLFSALPLPVYPVFGGHDGNLERVVNGPGNFNAMLFARYVAPPYYAWHWGGRHFISIMCESHFIDEQTSRMQDAFIAEDLRRFGRRMPVTVCAHKHPFPFNVAIFRRYRVDSWLHGHFHSTRLMHDGRIRVFSTGAAAMGNIDLTDVHGRVIAFSRRGKPRGAPLCLVGCRPAPVMRRRSAISIVWRSRLDRAARLARPCVAGDAVYCGSVDEVAGTHGGVAAFDRASGRPRWQRRLGASVEAPVVACGDRLVAVTHAGRAACLRRGDGRVLWEHELPEPFNRWLYAAPLLLGDDVVIGTSSCLACLSLETGRVRWQINEGIGGSDAMGRLQSPAAEGRRVLVIGPRPRLLHAASGRVAGTVEMTGRDGLRSRSSACDGRYVIGGASGHLCCFAVATGRLLWRRRISRSAIASGFVPFLGGLVGGTAEGVGRYGLADGRCLAQRSFGRDLRMFVAYRPRARSCMGTPAVDGDRVWAGSGDGYMNLLRGRSLELIARAALPAPSISSLAMDEDGRVFGADADGHLVCVRYTSASLPSSRV